MITTIVKLQVGDLVADSSNVIGKVVGFTQNHVRIAWEQGGVHEYTDDDLQLHGVRVVEGQR